MGYNKIVYGNDVKIDLTNDTIVPEALLQGLTAHDAKGDPIVGTAKIGYPFSDIFLLNPDSNTNSFTVEYDSTKTIALALCFDTTPNTSPGTYSMMSIFYQPCLLNTGSYLEAKFGVLTDYQGNERYNASYGACSIDETNHTITFAGQSDKFAFKSGRYYIIYVFYIPTAD